MSEELMIWNGVQYRRRDLPDNATGAVPAADWYRANRQPAAAKAAPAKKSPAKKTATRAPKGD